MVLENVDKTKLIDLYKKQTSQDIIMTKPYCHMYWHMIYCMGHLIQVVTLEKWSTNQRANHLSS